MPEKSLNWLHLMDMARVGCGQLVHSSETGFDSQNKETLVLSVQSYFWVSFIPFAILNL